MRTGACLLLLLAVPPLTAADAPDEVDFNRDVRHVLANHCFACHGPDAGQRKANLRLDQKDGVFGKRKGGRVAVAPGDLARSEMWDRISSEYDNKRMPPPAFGKPLTKAEIDLLKRWIEQGADYREHWAYRPIQRPEPPPVKNKDWPKGPLDAFVLARLEKEGLTPSPEADRRTLLRRVTFDLTGLPPTPQEIDDFVNDRSAGAYEKVVDRLLASPHYGERWAVHWLDLARYADTNGYHIDNHRDMWKWREWVIKAFNDNKRFDQFTIEQLAGDLLPNATLEQKIASGFHRNTMVNFEGGADANEYLTKYIVDRVVTTGTVWLGTTIACCECHDHKYDPFTQKDFYRLYAFFNGVPEKGLDGQKDNPVPSLRIDTPETLARRAELKKQRAALEARLRDALVAAKVEDGPDTPTPQGPREVVWVDDELPPGAVAQGNEGADSWKWVVKPAPVFSGERATQRKAQGLSQHFFTGATSPLKIGSGDKLFAHVWLDPQAPPRQIMLQFNDGTWEHRAYWGENIIPWGADNSPARRHMGPLPKAGEWVRLEVAAKDVGLADGARVNGLAFTQFDGTVYWDKAGLLTRHAQETHFATLAAWEAAVKGDLGKLPKEVQDALRAEPAKRSDAQKKALREHFVRFACSSTRSAFTALNAEEEKLKKAEADLEASTPSTMVMQEMEKPRDTFILIRGDWQTKGEKVTAGTPERLPPLPPKQGAYNRLDLAKWLVSPDQPLTARVAVNRWWEQLFGAGLVKTGEDFGSQGDWPSHPDLLDWLAADFVQSGWDVKRFHKQVVMSATYRQSSRLTPELIAKDPDNRLLARGPRFRLPAEMIRDNALAVSGLLNRQLGGPSVRPYQPAGLWEALAFGGGFSSQSYVQSHGPDLYRRGLYVYWKRSVPHPSLTAFDAPNREVCTDRRPRTNTPLQALTLLNDPIYVECARVLGQRVMQEGGASPRQRIAFAFKLCTARAPTEEEVAVLLGVYEKQRARLQREPEAAKRLVGVGESPRPELVDVAELATWTTIGNILLNLDETITKG
jgi:hypothetical protein